MSSSADSTDRGVSPRSVLAQSDSRLVRACLRGDEAAWSTLVDKYKNLVYSIAIKQGISPDDAADLFQSVWVQVYSKLSTLKKEGSIRSWLISVTVNKCYHWRQKQHRLNRRESSGFEEDELDRQATLEPPDVTARETQLLVQRAVAELPPRCQELIRLLFYTQPPLPYREVAKRLDLAVGSIGFIRGRCLKKLHKILASKQAL